MRVILQVRDEDVMISESALNLMLAFEAKGLERRCIRRRLINHGFGECIRRCTSVTARPEGPPRFEVECPTPRLFQCCTPPTSPGTVEAADADGKWIRTCHGTVSLFGAGGLMGSMRLGPNLV